MTTHEFSDEDIQRQLAGEAVRGPRFFRGRELAPLTKGLRDLARKVIAPADTGEFHDIALLHILAEAHALKPEDRIERRRALLIATDDVSRFRATVSLLFDELNDSDTAEARRVTDDLLGLIEKAEVSIVAEKKSEPTDPAELSPTPTAWTSGALAESPDGALISFAGNCPWPS